jgi:alkanesulfonate monooxygenase SsuD/methylene tetrahydromethanopterin reductase-like flavin-dependent oxidoreductase (luciferase family)/predicted kinase
VIRLAASSLVVLAGPSGAGKSTWAATWFRASQVVSSDALRAVVGEHQHDLRASTDSFDVLDLVVERRLARGLLTVVDTLGMDGDRHRVWLELAERYRRPSHLVLFDEDDKVYRKRNRARPSPVPSKVLSAQLARWAELRGTLGAGFDHVHQPGPAAVVPDALLAPPVAAPARLDFGLQLSSFDWPDGGEPVADALVRIVGEAERAGFTSIWVMDHFIQIPQLGPVWDPMLEAYATLGFLAGRSTTLRLGAMVSCVTHRNLAHLAKIVATLDVVSGGRAWCGLGLGWYQREHEAYGYRLPPVAERYELLEDDLAREEVERRVLAGVADTHVEAADRHEAACVRPLTAGVEHLDEHGIANPNGLAAVPNSSLILRAREMANAEAAELVGRQLDLVADREVRAVAVHGADPKHDGRILHRTRVARIWRRQHGAAGRERRRARQGENTNRTLLHRQSPTRTNPPQKYGWRNRGCAALQSCASRRASAGRMPSFSMKP